jgi:hypothetical protein
LFSVLERRQDTEDAIDQAAGHREGYGRPVEEHEGRP